MKASGAWQRPLLSCRAVQAAPEGALAAAISPPPSTSPAIADRGCAGRLQRRSGVSILIRLGQLLKGQPNCQPHEGAQGKASYPGVFWLALHLSPQALELFILGLWDAQTDVLWIVPLGTIVPRWQSGAPAAIARLAVIGRAAAIARLAVLGRAATHSAARLPSYMYLKGLENI